MKAIDFCLPDKEGKEVCLSSFRGKWIVLYFYPKDNTPGCTREAISFSDKIEDFRKLNAVVIGISKDSPESHSKFYLKHNLKVVLLSDQNKEVLKKYGVWKLKRLYGKESYGVERSTFLISPDFEIVKEWRKVKVDGHVDEVLNTLKSLSSKDKMKKPSPLKPGKYLHYKGKYYEVLGVARNAETLEEFVVYKALYPSKEFGDYALWVRPRRIFEEEIIVNGKKVPRFKYVGD